MGLGGQTANDQLPSFMQTLGITGDFNSKKEGVDLSQYAGQKFQGGDYAIPDDIKKGMAAFGQELIDLAQKKGVDLKKTREFSAADFDKDGKLSPMEVGSIALAASLDISNRGAFGPNDLTFDNDLSKKDTAKLLTTESRNMVMMIAKQMLADSGVKVSDAPGDAAVATAVNKVQPDTLMRC